MKRKYILAALVIMIALSSQNKSFGQANPMGALYFQNQFLGNPAYAGLHQGLDLNLGIRRQWSNLPGSPTMQTATADYAMTSKAGLGLNVYNDRSGLFKRTRAMASYAYHMPLSGEDNKLSFGLALGVMSERLSSEDIKGDQNDMSVQNYNQRDVYMDGDFGLAYTSSTLNVQAVLPNMKAFFKKDDFVNSIDLVSFYTAASYKITLTDGPAGIGLEPKVVYHRIKGFDNLMDAGVNLTFANNKLNFLGMYHSSKSTTFGMGLNYGVVGFQGIYTTATSALSNYTNGNFELSMKLKVF